MNLSLAGFAGRWDFCWACGIAAGQRPLGRPVDYWRNLEIHHLSKLLRQHDWWNLSRLCKLCHDLAEGYQIRDEAGELLPKLWREHVLWLKMKHDPRHYRRDFICRYSRSGKLPRAVRPPKFFQESYQLHRRRPYPGDRRLVGINC